MELGIQQQQHYASNRRSFLSQFCVSVISLRGLSPTLASATTVDLPSDKSEDVADDEGEPAFHSAAYGLEEYNNSIVASRDTNISPKEVYDTISSEYLRGAHAAAIAKNADTSSNSSSGRRKRRMTPKALDVGAGAGVSTEILYNMGYQTIDALDWSGKAWERYVIDDPAGVCPTSVQFYELDDERYLESWRRKYGGEKEGHSEQEEGANGLFDAIVFNFAINESKAVTFATELLNKDHGILLAPINTSTDYWLKQRYKVMDASGKVLWSADDVGAWSVLFQPDVTQDTCQGIWCSPYNGFQKKK
ncbi:hypothetical protein ACHAWU_002738 [Discostella pseudostelligera]|uniref:Methyltransferase type 11 domain-containing protein n=1 Tax=Discostella pseudostelligera TaxID=259834 RepID=A0ABD3MQ29_9STRA